jgi:hypothetical protein
MGLAKELNLQAGDKFNGDYQDRLGLHLLRRRGFDKWARGEMSDNAFMLNLAKEWASFPVPYTMKGSEGKTIHRGDSYYKGDGLNAAYVKPADVEATLRQARLAGAAPIPTPEPPIDTGEVPDDTATGLWAALVAAYNLYMQSRKAKP